MFSETINKTLAGAAVALVLAAGTPAIAAYVRNSRVEAYDTDVWTVWAPSGPSRVVVRGDGDTDLDCYVYAENGRLLGSDDDYTDYCIVDVDQRRAGDLRIEIKNLGHVWNAYRLTVR